MKHLRRLKLIDFSPIIGGSILVVFLYLTYYFLTENLIIDYIVNIWIVLTGVTIFALILIIQVKSLNQNRLVENLRIADEQKTNFLANMSHELRTPLNSIIGFSELLIDGNNTLTLEERIEFLLIINDSAQLLLQLINDVLSISKMESGVVKVENKEFSILDTVEQCTSLIKKGVSTHRFVVENQLLPQKEIVDGDPRLILQVLINLVGNAIKFTPENKSVGIILSGNSEELQITVWDEGIGIDKSDFDKLFMAFSQLESPFTKKHQGTGLGLYICKNIVQRHGGRIWVESTKEQGSRFSFTIPYSSKVTQVNQSAEQLLEKLWNKSDPK